MAVLQAFDPATFIRASTAFARSLSADLAQDWLANYTRTIFLAGNPQNLTTRHPSGRLSPDGGSLWFSPSTLDDLQGLSRLLRPFRGPLGIPPTDGLRVVVDEHSPLTAHLTVATDGLAIEDYLVHVNHTVAEACLQGLLDGVGVIEVTHVDAIDEVQESDYLRVLPDKGNIWAVLTALVVR